MAAWLVQNTIILKNDRVTRFRLLLCIYEYIVWRNFIEVRIKNPTTCINTLTPQLYIWDLIVMCKPVSIKLKKTAKNARNSICRLAVLNARWCLFYNWLWPFLGNRATCNRISLTFPTETVLKPVNIYHIDLKYELNN